MLFDSRDLSILRLAGKYHLLPYDILDKFGFDDLTCEVDKLALNNFICISRNKKYISPTPQGYSLLQSNGYDYDPGAKRPYADSSALRRRLEAAEIMLTCLRAGIDVYRDHVDDLQCQPVFLPAFSMRGGKSNVMNAANCAGFGHWGNKAYMLQYVSSKSTGMYPGSELAQLNNLQSIFDRNLKTPSALLLAGSSYNQVYTQITDRSPSKRHGIKGFADFWDVYTKEDIPIHLLSCDEMGAMQLVLMSQPDYNSKIAKAAFEGYENKWIPYDDEIPDANGKFEGKPFVIACDMSIRRINRVCAAARDLNLKEIYVAAFKEQLTSFLTKILPTDLKITYLEISLPIFGQAFSKKFSLNSLDMDSAATGLNGAVIHV